MAERNRPDGRNGRPSLSRRHFLRGLGASVAVPAFASLRRAGCSPPDWGRQPPGGDRDRRAARRGLRLLSERCNSRLVVAQAERGRMFR